MVPLTFSFATFGVFRTISVFIIICVMQPYMTIVIAIKVIAMICIYRWTVKSMVMCLRMDSIYRGPMNSSV
jgi:hypothetical protein